MSVESCFWALLSLESFDFIYLPNFVSDTQIGFGKTPGDILLHNSLLQYIHPEELSLAETDLMNFVRNKTLAGAVTRCRLKSVKSIIYQQYGECHNMDDITVVDWIITDVVMYTATNNTILTFFHSHKTASVNHTIPPSSTCCGSQQIHLNESNSVKKILELYLLPMKLEDRFRIFQIHDTSSKQLLISCPSCLYTLDELDSNAERIRFIESASDLANRSTVREMNKNVEHPQLKLGTAACTHHSYFNSTTILEPYGLCQIESIIIIYGSLTFSTYQVTPIINNQKRFFYQHYMRCTSTTIENDRTIPTNTFKRKSNINDILNTTEHTTITVTPSPPLQLTTASPTKSPSLSLLPLLNTTTTEKQPIPKTYNSKITIDTKTSSSSTSTSSSTRSPLPRAWRGRFGAYEKKCENCQTNTSPEWRKGPSGHKTLCNACGLRYARLIVKHEKRQAPKEEEDRSILTPNNNTTTNTNNNNNNKLKHPNTPKRKS